MWKVERDKVIGGHLVVAPYVVGVYRWRWVAILVAWWFAEGWWACHVSQDTSKSL